MTPQIESLKRAVERAGGQASLASKIEAKPTEVWQWLNDLRPIPPTKCVAIEQVTNAEVLRIDLYKGDAKAMWPELFDKATA